MSELDYKEKGISLLQGDCLERMKEIPDNSISMILSDPPYQTTACKWDTIIPLEPMWEQLKRITKPNGAIVMTASQPFTTTLIASNMKNYAHGWVWNKRFAANFVQAKRQPLKDHEDVLVFCMSGKQPAYYPQMIKREKPITKGGNKQSSAIPIAQSQYASEFGQQRKSYDTKYPTTVTSLNFSVREGRGLHPTQKPIALMEYLIRTYTNEGELILDNTMGSGTTGVAAKQLNRKFGGIELDEEYFNIAKQRIQEAEWGSSLIETEKRNK